LEWIYTCQRIVKYYNTKILSFVELQVAIVDAVVL